MTLPAMPVNRKNISKCRYLGRAIARYEAHLYRDEGEIVQPGSMGQVYRATPNRCQCAEFEINAKAAEEARQGIFTRTVPVHMCKHTLVAHAALGSMDLIAIAAVLPDPLKEEARLAYVRERDSIRALNLHA